MCRLLADRHSLAYSRLLVFSLPHETEFPLLIGQSCKKFSWVLRTETKANISGRDAAGEASGRGWCQEMRSRQHPLSLPCTLLSARLLSSLSSECFSPVLWSS